MISNDNKSCKSCNCNLSSFYNDFTHSAFNMYPNLCNPEVRPNTHLNPCSEPAAPSSAASVVAKYGFSILAFCLAACIVSQARRYGHVLSATSGDAHQQPDVNVVVIQEQMRNVRSAIEQIHQTKTEMDQLYEQMHKMLSNCRDLAAAKSDGDSVDAPGKTATDNNAATEALLDRKLQEAFDLYDADKTGLVDYALGSAGGMAVASRGTVNYRGVDEVKFLGMTLCSKPHGPELILDPSNAPGHCWAFKGESGAVLVQMFATIRVTGVTLEHVSKLVAPEYAHGSAPREFSIYGVTAKAKSICYGRFTYNGDGPARQYFAIDAQDSAVRRVEMRVHNNHGNVEYTCLYRLRVHGQPTDNTADNDMAVVSTSESRSANCCHTRT